MPCPHVNRDLQEQLDRQNYITKTPMTKLKDTNKKFSGQRGLEHRAEDQRRGKGWRGRKR